jgi:hypothetical protein
MSGVWTIAGWVFAIAGVAVAAWALFWDRPRGRRRCPKCWYDMKGSPGPKCPECGREPRAESALFRTRRRWGFAAVGMGAGFVAALLPGMPRVATEGWTGPIPTTVLIGAMPWLDPVDARCRVMNLAVIDTGWRGAPWRALESRSREDQVAPWQRRFMVRYLTSGWGRRTLGSAAWARVEGDILTACPQPRAERCVDEMADIVTVSVTTRPKWPQGVSVYGTVKPYRLLYWGRGSQDRDSIRWSATPSDSSLRTFSGEEPPPMLICGGVIMFRPWKDNLECLGTPCRPGPVRFEVKAELGQPGGAWRVVCPPHQVGDLDILGAPDGVDPASLVVRPVRSADFERALSRPGVAACLQPRFGPYVTIDVESLADELLQLDATFAVHAEVRRNGKTVGTAAAWWRAIRIGSRSMVFPDGNQLEFHLPNGAPVSLSETGGWSLLLRGDATTALRDLENDRYWEGEVEIPVQEQDFNSRRPL